MLGSYHMHNVQQQGGSNSNCECAQPSTFITHASANLNMARRSTPSLPTRHPSPHQQLTPLAPPLPHTAPLVPPSFRPDPPVCKPGFGFPPKPVDGSKPTTPPVCQPCTGNTASGPDAPKPTWPAKTDAVKTSKWGGKKGKKGMNTVEPATGGRHLLGMGGHHGHHSVCVACPNDTYANKGHTKCE